jgi:hypothetical protein
MNTVRHDDAQQSPLHQTASRIKRKRQHPVTIRKSARPTKRHATQTTHIHTQATPEHIRRNINELIAYIHSSQTHPQQQDDHRKTRATDDESGLRGTRRQGETSSSTTVRVTVREGGAGDELGLSGGTQRPRTQITENLSPSQQTTTSGEPSPPRIRLDRGRRTGLGGPGSEGCRRSGARKTETRPPQTRTQHTQQMHPHPLYTHNARRIGQTTPPRSPRRRW